ncbi:hypothetical protein FHS83_001714 [Rhizomicrobium palustre]|uniref:chitinase n=1 Tax=Rhizomicrobium palustre TaxID=189966 RepID=A0A846MYB2_9PROT|nr:glycoside hydrolase family 18 protein [Rhizomicrobium palustre]NIK88396.1 hypothetical protein [Rhizomicrobium palustre]
MQKIFPWRISAALLFAVLAQTAQARVVAGYFPSWESASALSSVNPAYSHVIVAFARPDFSWDGKSFAGTGLQFEGSPAELKRQIAAVKKRGTKVLLAVGGTSYLKWDALAAEAGKPGPVTNQIARFVRELGFDGIDVDYEIEGGDIAPYRGAILSLRRAAQGKTLSLAAWSTGADCTKATGTAPCGGKVGETDANTGRERLVFRDPAAAAAIDMVEVMSYDAGLAYDPVLGWQLYRALLPARVIVNIGFEPAPEGWGKAVLVGRDQDAVCKNAKLQTDQFEQASSKPYSVERSLRDGPLASKTNPKDGAMLWHVLKNDGIPLCGKAKGISADGAAALARKLLGGAK